jgi:hypothetical protein
VNNADIDSIRKHYGSLRDGELLRAAVLEGGTLIAPAQEVVREVVLERLGPPAALVQRHLEQMGKVWGRIQQVQTFSRLRGPNEPVLGGGRDVPPYDGVIFLADRGLGFVPSSPPRPEEIFPTLSDHTPGSMAQWWDGLLDAAAVPADQRDGQALYRLPLSLRARLDPTAAWIAKGDLKHLELRGLDLHVVVDGAGDALCRVPAPAPEFLARWGAQFDIRLVERTDKKVTDRVRGWIRRD